MRKLLEPWWLDELEVIDEIGCYINNGDIDNTVVSPDKCRPNFRGPDFLAPESIGRKASSNFDLRRLGMFGNGKESGLTL